MKIVHVDGVSGSGKSFLGRKIGKHNGFTVIDLDDIDDWNAMSILGNKKFDALFSKKNLDTFFELKDKMNLLALKKLIKKSKAKRGILVLVGLPFSEPINAKIKFFIKTNLDWNYRRLTLRTLASLCSHYEDIVHLLKSKTNVYKISMLLLHKYKVRVPLPENPDFVMERIGSSEKNAKKHDKEIKILPLEKIYEQILKLSRK